MDRHELEQLNRELLANMQSALAARRRYRIFDTDSSAEGESEAAAPSEAPGEDGTESEAIASEEGA